MLTPTGARAALSTGLLARDIYLGLHTEVPTVDNELTGHAYARVVVASDGWTVTDDADSGDARNATAIAFPTPTGAWADPTHVGLWDAATAGTLLAWAALADDVAAPTTDDVVRFVAGGLDISLPGSAS